MEEQAAPLGGHPESEACGALARADAIAASELPEPTRGEGRDLTRMDFRGADLRKESLPTRGGRVVPEWKP